MSEDENGKKKPSRVKLDAFLSFGIVSVPLIVFGSLEYGWEFAWKVKTWANVFSNITVYLILLSPVMSWYFTTLNDSIKNAKLESGEYSDKIAKLFSYRGYLLIHFSTFLLATTMFIANQINFILYSSAYDPITKKIIPLSDHLDIHPILLASFIVAVVSAVILLHYMGRGSKLLRAYKEHNHREWFGVRGRIRCVHKLCD